jgi:sugar diacid utilization regulator
MNLNQIANLSNLAASALLGLGLLAIELVSKYLRSLDLSGKSSEKRKRIKRWLSRLETAKVGLLILVLCTYIVSFRFLAKSYSTAQDKTCEEVLERLEEIDKKLSRP